MINHGTLKTAKANLQFQQLNYLVHQAVHRTLHIQDNHTAAVDQVAVEAEGRLELHNRNQRQPGIG